MRLAFLKEKKKKKKEKKEEKEKKKKKFTIAFSQPDYDLMLASGAEVFLATPCVVSVVFAWSSRGLHFQIHDYYFEIRR